MTLTREHLSPADGFDNRIDWQTLLDRWNERALRWVLGPGLLSLHLAAFGLSLLSAMTWNLIADPTDLRMVEPFRYWGIVAVVHTVLVGGGLVAWKIFGQPSPDSRRRAISASVVNGSRPQPASQPAPAWQTAWMRPVESVARVNSSARRWAANAMRTSEPARDAETGWPEQSPVANAATDAGQATWPASAPLSTTLAGADAPADEVVSVDHRDGDEHTKTWIDAFVESRGKDKENRWSWVEAAAAAWLNKREVEGKSEKALSASNATSDVPPPEGQTTNEHAPDA